MPHYSWAAEEGLRGGFVGASWAECVAAAACGSFSWRHVTRDTRCEWSAVVKLAAL